MELREALEQKYDEIESGSDGAAPVPETAEQTTEALPVSATAEPAPSTDETAEQKAERARDESGRFVKQEEKPAAKAPPARATKAPVAAAGKTTGAPRPGETAPPVQAAPVAPAPPAFRPPQSWKPGVREKFAALPPEVQQEVIRREKEIATALQQAAETGKAATPWTEATRPYEMLIRSSGMEPTKYVGNLLQTAHALSYGPPENKAAVLADIIAQFNVPPELLDRALVAKLQGHPTPQAQPQQFRDPRLDQLLAQAQQRKEAQAQQEAAEVQQQLSSFGANHEYYADVESHMADILDVWAKQGKTQVSNDDLERAYTLACQLNPDVAPLLEQRRAAEAAQKAAASTARARSAASSIKSSPTAAPAAQPKGTRSVLDAKADELERAGLAPW